MKAKVTRVGPKELEVSVPGFRPGRVVYHGDGPYVQVGSTIEVRRILGTLLWDFVRVVAT